MSQRTITTPVSHRSQTIKFRSAALAISLVFCSQAWAINKCAAPDGTVVFQDAPCAGKGEKLVVKPASGLGAAPDMADGAKKSNVQEMEATVAASQKQRRRTEVENIFLPQSKSVLEQHRRGCEQEQKDLASGQFKYVQNLYGKTHAAQIASEMAAASARCDTKDRELKEQFEALRSECTGLGGCKQSVLK